MQIFQVENESTKMSFQSDCWEIFEIPGPQQGNKRGLSQGHSYSNYEATSHSKGIEELPREGFLHPEVHP